jgi:hypothetical protein
MNQSRPVSAEACAGAVITRARLFKHRRFPCRTPGVAQVERDETASRTVDVVAWPAAGLEPDMLARSRSLPFNSPAAATI